MQLNTAIAAEIRRGQTYWVDFDPTVGSEQAGRRPCVIVSPNAINRVTGARVVTVVPVTTKGEADAVRIPVTTGGISGFALIHQVRVLDRSRLDGVIGELHIRELVPILTRLQQYFQP